MSLRDRSAQGPYGERQHDGGVPRESAVRESAVRESALPDNLPPLEIFIRARDWPRTSPESASAVWGGNDITLPPMLPASSPPFDLAPFSRHTTIYEEAEDVRMKRRKVISSKLQKPTGFSGFHYGKYGQAESGLLNMRLLKPDDADIILKGDLQNTVYCTHSLSMLLRHQGETVFSLDELNIKTRVRHEVHASVHGLVFISLDSSDILERTTNFEMQYAATDPEPRTSSVSGRRPPTTGPRPPSMAVTWPRVTTLTGPRISPATGSGTLTTIGLRALSTAAESRNVQATRPTVSTLRGPRNFRSTPLEMGEGVFREIGSRNLSSIGPRTLAAMGIRPLSTTEPGAERPELPTFALTGAGGLLGGAADTASRTSIIGDMTMTEALSIIQEAHVALVHQMTYSQLTAVLAAESAQVAHTGQLQADRVTQTARVAQARSTELRTTSQAAARARLTAAAHEAQARAAEVTTTSQAAARLSAARVRLTAMASRAQTTSLRHATPRLTLATLVASGALAAQEAAAAPANRSGVAESDQAILTPRRTQARMHARTGLAGRSDLISEPSVPIHAPLSARNMPAAGGQGLRGGTLRFRDLGSGQVVETQQSDIRAEIVLGQGEYEEPGDHGQAGEEQQQAAVRMQIPHEFTLTATGVNITTECDSTARPAMLDIGTMTFEEAEDDISSRRAWQAMTQSRRAATALADVWGLSQGAAMALAADAGLEVDASGAAGADSGNTGASVDAARSAGTSTSEQDSGTSGGDGGTSGGDSGEKLMIPYARFCIDSDATSCTVRFDPPVTARFVLVKLWLSQPEVALGLVTVTVKGFAGPRCFPMTQLQ